MNDELRNWNNWRYLPLGTKERQAWHYMLRLEIQNKELNDRIKNVTFEFQGIEKKQRERIAESCQIVESLFGGAAADEFRKAMK